MNTTYAPNEEVLEHALQLLEEGKSKTFILEAYPAHTKDLEALFESIGQMDTLKDIRPSKHLVEAILAKEKNGPVVSPLNSSFSFWRRGAATFAALVLVIGGTSLYIYETVTNSTASTVADNDSSTSDAALGQDAANIDNQLGALNADQAQIDQALQAPSGER
jgi:hypothetical protein